MTLALALIVIVSVFVLLAIGFVVESLKEIRDELRKMNERQEKK